MSTPPAVIRPYTSYNLFFQLERDYILQTLLGFKPTIASKSNIFDPADRTNYQGPPLPSRYSDLVLPYDWHIPGKTIRRKRSHRKSHGKIGFHELNEKISKAWSMVDDETRDFCMILSDIESAKYKKSRGENVTKVTRRRKTKKTTAKPTKKKPKNDDYNDLITSFDWAVRFPQDDFSQSPFHIGSDYSSHKICCMVSCGSVHTEQEDLSLGATNRRDSVLTEVDMDDDEIIDIWKSIPIEEGIIIPSLQSTYKIRQERSNPGSTGTQEKIRISFIDNEYEKFKEIGKQFSTKKKLGRKVLVARQA